MAKRRILKKQNKAYIELPQEMFEYDELELYQLKEGYYMLSLPEKRVGELEKAVLRKLLSIRFEKRTPDYVQKALTEAEKIVLKDLEKKGMVNVFKGTKYPNGVYNIKDNVYPLLKQNKEVPVEKKEEPAPSGSFGILTSRGYITITEKKEAYGLSQRQEMKTGSIVGVKGFDGKFYIVTRDYLTKAQTLINKVLREEMDIPSIATSTKLDLEGCTAVLKVMAENGDILEKKRGVYAPV